MATTNGKVTMNNYVSCPVCGSPLLGVAPLPGQKLSKAGACTNTEACAVAGVYMYQTHPNHSPARGAAEIAIQTAYHTFLMTKPGRKFGELYMWYRRRRGTDLMAKLLDDVARATEEIEREEVAAAVEIQDPSARRLGTTRGFGDDPEDVRNVERFSQDNIQHELGEDDYYTS